MFTPPSQADRIRAVGPVTGLPPALRRALDEQGFSPIPRPGPHDWLASHPEPGQTFAAFLAGRPPRLSPGMTRPVLYLQPFGSFYARQDPQLDPLSRFAAAFFALEVKVLPALPVTGVTMRINSHTGQRQLLTRDLLALLADQRPAGACCVLGITMEDLYPGPTWNFVFGEASPRDRVGVYSFARYRPGEADGASLLLRRSCKVLAHETAHLLGIAHCVFYSCLMNGSNHLAESDARPLHPCPVDLRKLQHTIGFEINARYRNLRTFTEDAGFADEARWLTTQLLHIEQDQVQA